jgi:antitoxin HigA-1
MPKSIRRRRRSRPKLPTHPGRIVRDDCLGPLGLSVTAGAKVLGVRRQTLNNLVNGKSGISVEMAIRLAKAFGSAPEAWLRVQLAYDLGTSSKSARTIRVRRRRLPRLAENRLTKRLRKVPITTLG